MEGTLKPYEDFDAETDAGALREAMKGLGTSEDEIVAVLGARTNDQRMEIVTTFKTMYGKDLVEELESELNNNFLRVCKKLCQSRYEFLATCLNEAIKGAGTDEQALVEILCTASNPDIEEIKTTYEKMFEESLEDAVIGDTSGYFQRLLVSMLTANRSEEEEVDEDKAAADALRLFEAGEDQLGTDESEFNVVLALRSYPHLRMVFDLYEGHTGKPMEEVIESEMSGNLAKGMRAIVECVKNMPGYFARTLYESMKGLGTDDETLLRVIISRCEVDMVQIKEAFQEKYDQSLGDFIKDDCSGDYEKILLMLVDERSDD